MSVVHRCPEAGSGVTPCCGRTVFELQRTDRLTMEEAMVTCSIQHDIFCECRGCLGFCPSCEVDREKFTCNH